MRLTAKAPQDARSLVAFLVESHRPKGFTPNLVCESVDRRTQLVCPAPGLIEALFAARLGLVP